MQDKEAFCRPSIILHQTASVDPTSILERCILDPCILNSGILNPGIR
jgi:hypothetical protein